MKQLRYAWKVLKKGAAGFDSDNCFRYSAALSFYTLFSIAPIVLISVYTAGLFADFNLQKEVTEQFSKLVGEKGAQGIEVLLESLQDQQQSYFQLIVGVVVLLFSATNIFIQMQGAFNEIYSVRPRQGRGLLKQVLARLISLGMIVSLGFVMIISLVLDSIIMTFKSYLESYFNNTAVLIIAITQNLVMMGLVWSVIFALFHFLPDVKIRKSFKLKGSFIITLLLFIGKFAIGWYIGNSHFNELGGASASIIILMLWVFYSSLIMFFGAELIKGMAKVSGVEFPASGYAVKVKSVKVEKDE